MNLAKMKEWYAERPVSLGPTYCNIGWLIDEVERLTAKLEWSESTSNFDATRLRRVATLVGAATPESDETLLGCAGVVPGSIAREIEAGFKKRDADISRARAEGMEEAAKELDFLCCPEGNTGCNNRILEVQAAIRAQAAQEASREL